MEPSRKPNWVWDVLAGVVLFGLLVAIFILGFPPAAPLAPAGILTSIYLQLWGVLFILSYFFSDRTYLLRGLMWLCTHTSRPRGRWTAILWGIFAIAMGLLPLAAAAGLVRWRA